jgi:hypothetical protein
VLEADRPIHSSGSTTITPSGAYVTVGKTTVFSHKSLPWDTLMTQQSVAKDPRFLLDSGF